MKNTHETLKYPSMKNGQCNICIQYGHFDYFCPKSGNCQHCYKGKHAEQDCELKNKEIFDVQNNLRTAQTPTNDGQIMDKMVNMKFPNYKSTIKMCDLICLFYFSG